MSKKRCAWADSHPLLAAYHDREWGRLVRDDRRLFEMLNLEGAQAGLSWLIVLKKREGYRAAFAGFDAARVARFDARRRAALMRDEGIVRNRLKIQAVFENAKAYLAVRRELGSFARYVWSFSEGRPIPRSRRREAVAVSERMSRELRKRGFRFVGATICYAFMQAIGMVDDHSPDCYRTRKAKLTRPSRR